MKKQNFKSVGLSEREAGFQLLWTMSWSLIMLVITLVSIFRP